MQSQWIENYITVDDLEFHYTRTGNGANPVVLLLHGFTDNGLCWLRVARDLEDRYDVIMPDARGHGHSARLRTNEPIDNAADTAGIIRALSLPKPVVGGHSMGGLTATELGARYPDLIRGLILEDPAWIDLLPEDNPTNDNPFHAWLASIDEVPLEEIIASGKMMNPDWSDSEFPAWAESKRQIDKNIFNVLNLDKPWRELVAAITVPTLLITADVQMGAIVSPEAATEAASLSPFLQTVHIPDAGHNIRRESYPAYMQAVKAFLEGL